MRIVPYTKTFLLFSLYTDSSLMWNKGLKSNIALKQPIKSGLAITTCSINAFLCRLFTSGSYCAQDKCGCDQPVWCFHTTKNEWMLWYVYVLNWNEFNPWLMLVILCVCRSMHKLTQLERLDLGSNEFTEVVSSTCLSFSCRMHYCSLRLPSGSQCSECRCTHWVFLC